MLPPTQTLDAYNRVMLADPGELDLVLAPDALVGELPDALRGGTWWGNGPTGLRVGDRLVHPFDGHGYVRALRFERDGRIRLRARPVQTAVFAAERAAGSLLETGLGTRPSRETWTNFRSKFARNVANTCVLPRGDEVLALWEGGHPHRLRADTLETLGTSDFHGALHPREAFCAHTRTDPETGHLIGLSPRMLGTAVSYTVRELDDEGREVRRNRARLDAFNVAHDFVITPRWVLVLENSIDVSLVGLVRAKLGIATILEALAFGSRNARLLMIPRGGGEARVVDLGRPLLSVHHANAWEEGEKVVFVTCGMAGFRFGTEFGWRGQETPFDPSDDGAPRQEVLRFDVEGGSARARVVGDVAIDFPTVRADRIGRPTRHLYGMITRDDATGSLFPGVAHVDLESGRTATWHPAEGIVGEPLLAARGPDEDEAFLLVMRYAPSGAYLEVLDAKDVARGPVATVRLPVALPFGFHGFWQAPN